MVEEEGQEHEEQQQRPRRMMPLLLMVWWLGRAEEEGSPTSLGAFHKVCLAGPTQQVQYPLEHVHLAGAVAF